MRWALSGALWTLRRFAGFALGYAIIALAAFGVFRDPSRSGTPQLLALAGLTALLLARLVERLRRSQSTTSRAAVWAELELGTLFVAAAFVVIEITGGPTGLLYPLIYALVAFLVAFHSRAVSLYFLGLILATEAAIVVLQPAPDAWRIYASHASFIILFGFLYAVFLRGDVAQRRNNMEQAIESHLRSIADEAKNFRLTSALSIESRDLSVDELHRRRQVGSVQAIHESLYNVLAVAERAVSPHTVALFWMDADDRRLRLKELRSQSDHIAEKPIAAGVGFIGAITKRREPLVLTHLKPGHSGLVYYTRPEAVTDFAGVPVLEGQFLRGVLVADRKNGEPFDDADVGVLSTIAAEVVRVVQVERIFADMDREKYQRDRFYEASREFNTALTIDQVAQVAIQTARRVANSEVAAVAVATDSEGILRIAATDWPTQPDSAKKLVGQQFAAEAGLVGAAIKARHPLPHGTARSAQQCIFTSELDLAVDYVKVLPLLWKDIGVGALVLGSSREGFLPLDVLDMLRVIADHAAIAIANAQMYESMERMATTDGLTGLVNHRHFQELFDGMLARCERYGRKLSVIICDIDHFKSVNDTYGHPVGDKVLKGVARVLAASARRTDVVARYGGEEFAVLMEETDCQGAVQIAERIREAVQAQVFPSENGTFQCTLSLGVATFPNDATSKAKVTQHADQALYHAKNGGRNQTCSYSNLSRAQKTA